jgi:hypothetical protein
MASFARRPRRVRRCAQLAVIRYAKIHGTKHRPWLTALVARRPTKVAAFATAGEAHPTDHLAVCADTYAESRTRVVVRLAPGPRRYQGIQA